jgi:hypothetical protein
MVGQLFIHELELVKDSKFSAIWVLSSTAPLSAMMTEHYWQRFAERGLKRHDRIMVSASINEPESEYADVIVQRVAGRRVTNVLLLSQAGLASQVLSTMPREAPKRLGKAKVAA